MAHSKPLQVAHSKPICPAHFIPLQVAHSFLFWVAHLIRCYHISAERKKKTLGERIPLTLDIDLYSDTDAASLQVQLLHKRIGKLGLVDRAIILLWLEDISYEEIGAIVGISPQNVGVKLYRIKEQLKAMHD